MKTEIKSMLDTTKKKAMVAAACGTLIIGISAGAVYASNNTSTEKPEANYMVIQGKQASDGEKSLVKNENGVITHSTDDGQTWISGAPEGAVISENANDLPPLPEGAKSLMVKDIDGKKQYSTDGGKTWSEQAPEGVETIIEDGKSTTSMGGLPPIPALKEGSGLHTSSVLKKDIDGKSQYSTDGGNTWSDQAPEGIPAPGEEPPAGAGFMAKNENGKMSYSTDGGQTWSDKAPDGMTITTSPDGKTDIKMSKSDL